MKILDIISEEKKNCGCGKDPCETYGKQQESKDEYKPHMMYKGSKKDYRAKYPTKKKHHDSLMNRGYNHDDPETKKVEERYGVRDEPNPGTSKAMQRQVNAINTNVTKRTNNKNADTNRELNIANKSLQRRANRLQRQKPTGIPNRILNPQPQPTPQQGQS